MQTETNHDLPETSQWNRLEDLMINAEEHKILKKFRKTLQKRFSVQICMPDFYSVSSDVIFVSILGKECNRNRVKKFLAEKINVPAKDKDEVILITLSDSEKDDSDCESESSTDSDDCDVIDITEKSECEPSAIVAEINDQSVCIIDSPMKSEKAPDIISSTRNPLGVTSSDRNYPDVISLTENSPDMVRCMIVKKRKGQEKVSVRLKCASSSSDTQEVTSTTDDMVSKKAKLSESVVVLEEITPEINAAVDFIPLQIKSKSVNKKHEKPNGTCHKSNESNAVNDIKLINESDSSPRCLRPIVIDGSNVAIEHGRRSQSFSVKGIKLAIDYFLNRGHNEVIAFVPKWRRHMTNPNRKFPTTDIELFKDLEKEQRVVYTPSRRINGKCVASYDDRFIVQLAAANKGVIVSNDNFRDLVQESDSFKETIEKRLLMYLFAGDVFMIPEDPLGREGPTLKEFLTVPPDSEAGSTETAVTVETAKRK